MRGFRNRLDLIVIFEQRARMSVACVVGLGIAIEDTLRQQSGGMFGILSYQEVIVIGHQAIRDHRQLELGDIFPYFPEDKHVVVGFFENRYPMRTAIVEVIVLARQIFGAFLWHQLWFLPIWSFLPQRALRTPRKSKKLRDLSRRTPGRCAGFAVHSFRISIKIADFKKALTVNNECFTKIGQLTADSARQPMLLRHDRRLSWNFVASPGIEK